MFFDTLSSYISVVLIAMFFQNILFSNALGIGRIMFITEKPKLLPIFTVLITVATTLSNIASYFLNVLFLKDYQETFPFEPFIYVTMLIVVFLIISLILRYALPEIYKKHQNIIPLAVFNCAVLGTMILAARGQNDLTEVILTSIANGVGFFIASIIIKEGKAKLAEINCPEAFRGLPSELLFIGIISMALFGFNRIH